MFRLVIHKAENHKKYQMNPSSTQESARISAEVAAGNIINLLVNN
jgi:hypothetical protein